MDPVSHGVLGRVLVKAVGPDRPLVRGAGAAAALGALSPDVDFVLMPFGWDIYLRAHEMGTHSVAGAILTGLGSAAIVRAIARRGSYRTFALAATLGALSHLAADLVSGARLRPLWPLTDHVVALPLVGMGDPWTIGILAGGALASWKWRGGRRAARLVLAALMVFLAFKGAMLATVLSRSAFAAPTGWSLGHVAEAEWGSLAAWRLFDRTPDEVRARLADARTEVPVTLFSHPIAPNSPRVETSKQFSTVRNFLSVHAQPFVVEEPYGSGDVAVLWSDIRYCASAPAAQGRREEEAGVHPRQGYGEQVSRPASVICTVWFGGIFDRDGRALSEQVRVGGWIQSRGRP